MEFLDLRGQTALIVGVANQHSLAWAVARHLHAVEAMRVSCHSFIRFARGEIDKVEFEERKRVLSN